MTPAEDIEDTDPGLARERTELAWTRMAISFAALGGAILRYRPAAGLPILIISAVVWELGRLPRTSGSARSRDRRLLPMAVTITGVGFAALILTFI